MGWVDDLKNAVNPVYYWSKTADYLGGNNEPAPPGYSDPRDTFKPLSSKRPETEGYAQKLFGGQKALVNSDLFNRAYQALGQPLHDQSDRGPVVMEGTLALARSFIDRFNEKTGKLPTEDQVGQFVNQNLTPTFAKDFILGMPPDKIKYGIVDPFLEGMDIEALAGAAAKPGESSKTLEALQNKLYDQYLGMAGDYTKRQFAPLRTRAIEEEAALGRLRSPVSAAPSSPIQQIGHEEANVLSDTIRDLLKSRAEGTVDLYKFGESLGAGERRAKEAGRQFRDTLGFERERFGRQSEQQDEANRIAREIGRLQAGSNKPGALDYVKTGADAASSVAMLALLGESNESFCSLVAIKNSLAQIGIKIKMSDIFKVIEDKGYKTIDYGYLDYNEIREVIRTLGANAILKRNAKLNGSQSPAICAIHCKDLYGIEGENWHHAVVVMPDRKMIDGYEYNLIKEYPNGRDMVDHASKFDWESWRGDYFLVTKHG